MRGIKVFSLVLVGIVVMVASSLSGVSATVPYVNEAIDISTIGTKPNVGANSMAYLSNDGRFVAFTSRATNLVAGATTPNVSRVYLRDRLVDTTTLISVSTAGVMADGSSVVSAIGSTGRYVVFGSYATNLIDGTIISMPAVYLRDTQLNTTALVSSDSSGNPVLQVSDGGGVSSDGRYVTFQSSSSNVVPGMSTIRKQIYRKDMATGVVVAVSKNSSGVLGNADSNGSQMSCDGRFVTFHSVATNLPSGTGGVFMLYEVDLLSGEIANITPTLSVGTPAAYRLSCNGNYIAFNTNASNIVSGDTNGVDDAFIYDRINNTYTRGSVDAAGNEANGQSNDVAVSDSGRYLVFSSYATNLVAGDTNNRSDIFLKDMQTGTVELVTKASASLQSNGFSIRPNITSDGQYVSFMSDATTLISGYSSASAGFAAYIAKTGIQATY